MNEVKEIQELQLQEEAQLQKLIEIVGKQPQVECTLVNSFGDGLYMRELHMPKDSLIVGKRHRNKTMNILVKGTLILNDGKDIYEVSAPYMFESEARTRRILYTLTDCIWLNCHPTNTTDLDELEKEIVLPEEEYLNLEVS